MSELKTTTPKALVMIGRNNEPIYLKSEVDKQIKELEENHKKEVEQLLMEIAELKNRIAPKQSDKTLQERLNEVCEKHGVSTLQDLDWAFCECEKRHTKDCIEADKVIARNKYKRCLAMARWCERKRVDAADYRIPREKWEFYDRWHKRWLKIAYKFKE